MKMHNTPEKDKDAYYIWRRPENVSIKTLYEQNRAQFQYKRNFIPISMWTDFHIKANYP